MSLPSPVRSHWKNGLVYVNLAVIWLILLAAGYYWWGDDHPIRMALPWGLALAALLTWNGSRKGAGFVSTLVITTAYGPALWQRLNTDRVLELLSVVVGTVLAAFWLQRGRNLLLRESRLARRDFLTDVANRQALIEALTAEFARLARHQRPCSVVLLDCDGFKQLNDTFGHAKGDSALVTVARTLQQHVRSYDTVARLGGDEFVLILSEADLIDAEEIMERLVTQLRFELEREFPKLTVTAGVVVFRVCPLDVSSALQLADQTMYSARQRGRGRVEFHVYDGPATETAMPATITLKPRS